MANANWLHLNVFNLQDLLVFYGITICVLFALLLCLTPKKARGDLWLSTLLLLVALRQIDNLIYWHPELNKLILQFSVDGFFVLGLSTWLLGPITWQYIRSVTGADWHWRQLWHGLPALIYLIYMLWAFYGREEAEQIRIITDYQYRFSLWRLEVPQLLMWLLPLIYSVASLRHLTNYRLALEEQLSNPDEVNLHWLYVLIGGLMSYWLFLFLSVLERQTNFGIGSSLGQISSLLQFFLINFVIFTGLRHSSALTVLHTQMHQWALESKALQDTSERTLDLHTCIQQDGLFLKPNLTLEFWATKLAIHPRLLSEILNGQYQKNFYEFVNEHRIQHAKNLLLKDAPQLSITDVMMQSGYQSKSTFNAAFKRYAGMTPTQFRRSQSTFKKTDTPSSEI